MKEISKLVSEMHHRSDRYPTTPLDRCSLSGVVDELHRREVVLPDQGLKAP